MAFCSKCGNEVPDGTVFCPSCGSPIGANAGGTNSTTQQGAPQYQPQYVPAPIVPEWDHTAEFDAKDISENKVFALLGYLFGLIGVLFVYLGAKESPYAMYHAKNAVTIAVLMGFVSLATAVLSWTCIVPVAGAVCIVILLVLDIICIFQVFGGKAKDPAIIRGLGFLK